MDINKLNELRRKIEEIEKGENKEQVELFELGMREQNSFKEQLELYRHRKMMIKEEATLLKSGGGNVVSNILGDEIKNEYGSCFCKKKVYINKLGNISIPSYDYYLKGLNRLINSESINLSKSIFLDIETTNIESGAANAAYLIGIGFFDACCFIVHQYFMRDFDEEAAILSVVNNQIADFNALFSFNGKRFDINVLENRYKINRIPFYLKEMQHIDMLDIFRKIYGNKSGRKLNLISLEEYFLDLRRIIQIPSNLIPEVYYQYLRSGNSDLIEYVFEHNAQDISSLAGLTLFVDSCLENPGKNDKIAGQLYYLLGKINLKEKKEEEAKDYFLKALNYRMEPRIFIKNCAELCRLYINEGNYKEATDIWIDLFFNKKRVLTASELKKIAIHFERYDKDLVKAFYFAMEGKNEIFGKSNEYNKIKVDFEKRIFRLIKKILKEGDDIV